MFRDIVIGALIKNVFRCADCASSEELSRGGVASQDIESWHCLKNGSLDLERFDMTQEELDAFQYPMQCATCSKRFFITDDEVSGYWQY